MIEEPQSYRVEMDAPGLKLAQIRVSRGPVAGTLAVHAEPQAIDDATGQRILAERAPRLASGWSRAIPIAYDADVSKATPTLQDGVLSITIPKTATPHA